ncbi:MAG: hypothetical protein M3430_04650 [Acidobacteriota bacterium]|nr:hypothetical protein [Acidobacteriota bacterium]
MNAAIKNQLVPLHLGATEEARTEWHAIKRRWTLRCPQCGQTWLVIGARAGDEHKCKSCHYSFVIESRR